MIVSTKGRYALRIMTALAKHPGEYLSLKDVAEGDDIPHKYAESIMVVLSKAGLVDGSRGKNGGYKLNRAPEEYTVSEILKLTETSMTSVSCLETPENPCPKSAFCPSLPMWKALDETIDNFFKQYTLKDFL